MLFSEPATERTGRLRRTEPAVLWYTEITRPEAAADRRVVNVWYEAFPDSDDRRIQRTARSDNNNEHWQAVDELYVDSLLRRMHADVRYEGEGLVPDCNIYENGAYIGRVEVVSLFQQQDWTDEQMRGARLADAIDDAIRPTQGYFIDLQIDHAEQDPVAKRFIRFLIRELANLPPHEQWIETHPERLTLDDLPLSVFCDPGVVITVHYIPMRPDAPAKTDPDARIVGMDSAFGGVVKTASRIRDRVEAKAGGRYDGADVPFAVAVCMHHGFSDDHEIINGLFGGDVIYRDGRQVAPDRRGVFGIDGVLGERNRRLSAVAVVRGLEPRIADGADVALFRNPFASHRWPARWIPHTREFGVASETADELQLGWIA